MLRHLKWWWITAALCSQVWAGQLVGQVVRIADGDTITVADGKTERFVVRLAGIDAPENDQPFGVEAKANLAALTLNKAAIVDWHKRDRYGRLVGRVTVDGIDISLAQIRAGLAWHYKDYQSEQSAADRHTYAQEESLARQSHRGLWNTPESNPPWEWRKSRGMSP